TRVRAAVRFDGRGVIVRLDLEADVVLVVEAYDAGIVLENAHAPILGPETATNLLRGSENGLLQQIVDASPGRSLEIDLTFQRLVRTVFGPGLRQRFQLDI